jgi:hypothetical protein
MNESCLQLSGDLISRNNYLGYELSFSTDCTKSNDFFMYFYFLMKARARPVTVTSRLTINYDSRRVSP